MIGFDLLELTDTQQMIVESTRAVVPGDGSLDRVRGLRFAAPGFDRAMMAVVAENGWPLLRVAESDGGLGLGVTEWCTLMRVLGAALVPEPVLSTVLAGALLGAALPDSVLAGETVLVTAWQDRDNGLDWTGGACAEGLTGAKRHVPGVAGADLFAVVTGQGLAVVPRDAGGLTIAQAETLDGGASGTLSFDATPAAFLPLPDVPALLDEATLAQSAYLLGISERALQITLDYLKVREQFGKPIGSFQALQHRATEMTVQLDLLRAAIFATARRIDAGASALQRMRDVSRCKRRAADLALHVAGEAVQMHGAMGITDEADIGLFVRKAMVEANILGSARVHRARFVSLLEEAAA